MNSISLFDLLKQVITSWQIIFITIALIIYLALVFYVARLYHRNSFRHISKSKKSRKVKKHSAEPVQVSGDEEDSLGLEEENMAE